MSKQKANRKRVSPSSARFNVGDRVRVRHGIKDEGYPDMPLGGWAGTIDQVRKHKIYSVHWSRETLANVHPIYKKRCAIDREVLEEYYLSEGDLEPDIGGPLTMEQPTRIAPRPLSTSDQFDRLRMVFGLTSDDFLPAVDEDSLEAYYDHLAERMSLPGEAHDCPPEKFFNRSMRRTVKVIALDRDFAWNETVGIFCTIQSADKEEVVPLTEVEFRRTDPNRQLVDDFAAWFQEDFPDQLDNEWADIPNFIFQNVRKDDGVVERNSPKAPESAIGGGFGTVISSYFLNAAMFGAVVGSAVAVVPWARWAVCFCGGALGVLQASFSVRHARTEMPFVAPRFQKIANGTTGTLTGIVQGALIAVMAVGFIGAALGFTAGAVMSWFLSGKSWKSLRLVPRHILLAMEFGVIAQLVYLDRASATTGVVYGALAGGGGGLVFALSVVLIIPLIAQKDLS